MNVVIVSYFPMVPFVEDMQEVEKAFEKYEENVIVGCGWTLNEHGNAEPVLLANNAKSVRDHLIAWSEGEPEKWFDLCIVSDENRYTVGLVPKIEKSVERHKIAYQLKTGYPLPIDTSFNVIFRSLQFISEGIGVYGFVKNQIGDKVKVMISEASEASKKEMGQVYAIGDFEPRKSSKWSHDFVQKTLSDGESSSEGF